MATLLVITIISFRHSLAITLTENSHYNNRNDTLLHSNKSENGT